MATAKDIRVAPVSAKDANALVQRVHYSGKVVPNSQLHLGVFLDGRLEGVMQFGPSMDKRKIQGLVTGTAWNGFIELNRMAFSERLPRNSESRALAIAFRIIRKNYPHIEWVVSFSDGAQCGDGTIYRASGFVLTQIKENSSIYDTPSGIPIARMTWDSATPEGRKRLAEKYGFAICDVASFLTKTAKMNNMEALRGNQLRYIYFLNPAARDRLTVPVIPFDRIDEIGAGMYKGQRVSRSERRPKQAEAGDQSEQRRCNTDPDAPPSQVNTQPVNGGGQ